MIFSEMEAVSQKTYRALGRPEEYRSFERRVYACMCVLFYFCLCRSSLYPSLCVRVSFSFSIYMCVYFISFCPSILAASVSKFVMAHKQRPVPNGVGSLADSLDASLADYQFCFLFSVVDVDVCSLTVLLTVPLLIFVAVRRRTELALPAPQVTDGELEELVKMGAQAQAHVRKARQQENKTKTKTHTITMVNVPRTDNWLLLR